MSKPLVSCFWNYIPGAHPGGYGVITHFQAMPDGYTIYVTTQKPSGLESWLWRSENKGLTWHRLESGPE